MPESHEITFPDAVQQKLAETSKQTGKSMPDIVRAAVAKYLRVSLDDDLDQIEVTDETPQPAELGTNAMRAQAYAILDAQKAAREASRQGDSIPLTGKGSSNRPEEGDYSALLKAIEKL